MPSIERVLSEIQKEFENLLSTKTSWGRNEIKGLLERAKSQALMRLMSETQEQK